jgi:two-component system phosphate regulon sensor histidine kinase PhoR
VRDTDDAIGLHQAILEASGVGLLVIGADGLVALVNSRFKDLVRVRVDPLGRPALVAIALAELSEVVERVSAGENVDDVAVATGSADLQIRGRSLPGNRVLIEVHDVTAWQQAERARRDFIANVSHELRTPITAVMGYAETLLADRNELPAEMVSMLDAVERNALRLRDLFDALLRLHRIETRRRQLPLQMQDVLPLLKRAMSTATDHGSRRGLTLTLDCPPTLQAAVNEEALVTMFSNLVNNACQYSEPGGTVDVSAALEDDAVVVRVIDQGIGIESRHHERIFERFYRGDGGRSHRPSGTGLGLAIVRHLALASGCGLSVQSEPGQGSEFAVHIPRRASVRSRV